MAAREVDGEFQRLTAFLREQSARRANLPVFLYGERRTIEKVPSKLLKYIHGFIFPVRRHQELHLAAGEARGRRLHEEPAAAVLQGADPSCGRVELFLAYAGPCRRRGIHQVAGRPRIPSVLWREHPAQRSVDLGAELGSLLDHTGPIKDAENEAARNFGADHTFFVTNGTSTANKIVWHGTVARGDVVFVDRNCHKSLLHALIMTGAVPVYFTPSRNAHGIIGPISLDQFTPESLQQRIAANPLASQAYKAGSKPRIAVVTNSTYDGLCYNAEKIADEIAAQSISCIFDEAWYAYAAFHPFYENHYGMAKGKPREQDAIIFTTHSTHKLLAAFSQASMIHVRNSAQRNLDAERFNESFMMHTSTSPHYGVIAACDVASKMMEGDAGRSLVQEMHDEAIAFRRAMLHVRDDLGRDDWWFSVWQPNPGRAQPGQGRNAGTAGGQARGVVPAAGRALARLREPG